jgi:hypothetical protein
MERFDMLSVINIDLYSENYRSILFVLCFICYLYWLFYALKLWIDAGNDPRNKSYVDKYGADPQRFWFMRLLTERLRRKEFGAMSYIAAIFFFILFFIAGITLK